MTHPHLLQLVMSSCTERIKDTFYMGTSGFPAAAGGILNPPDCNSTNTQRGKGQVTRIGDLCIPAFTLNWDCKEVRLTGRCPPPLHFHCPYIVL